MQNSRIRLSTFKAVVLKAIQLIREISMISTAKVYKWHSLSRQCSYHHLLKRNKPTLSLILQICWEGSYLKADMIVKIWCQRPKIYWTFRMILKAFLPSILHQRVLRFIEISTKSIADKHYYMVRVSPDSNFYHMTLCSWFINKFLYMLFWSKSEILK